MKKVTIAIATFNHAQYLLECLNSALNQTYGSIEIVVINDASTDRTHDIIHSLLPSAKIRYFKNDKNTGIVKTYNRLLELAAGDYFMVLGDDDFLGTDYVERMVNVLEKRCSCRVAFGRNVILNQNGSVREKMVSNFGEYISGQEYLHRWFSKHSTFQQHSFIMMFCSTERLRKTAGFPNFEMAQHADNAVLMKMVIDGEIGYDPKAAYYYRVYSQSYGNQHVTEVGKATRQFIDYFETVIYPLWDLAKGKKAANMIRKGLDRMLTRTFIHRILLYYYPKHSFKECLYLFNMLPKRNLILYYKFILKYFILKYFSKASVSPHTQTL